MRRVVVMLMLMLGVGLSAASQAAPADPVELVRSLYAREAARHTAKRPMTEAEFVAVFSSDLKSLWQAARGKSDPAAADGKKLNAYFGWGVLPGQPVTVRRVDAVPGAGRDRVVSVELTVADQPRLVFVHLVEDGGRWAVGNFIYDGGEDFRHVHERLAGL